MDEREVRERLNDAASAFSFRLESSEPVVRRTRARILRRQVLAAVVVAGALVIGASVLTRQESRIAPAPRPAGPGPNETVPAGPEVDHVIDLNTGEVTPLPEAITGSVAEGESDRYALSPDGSMLAFVGVGDGGKPQIFIAGIDGTGVRDITRHRTGATAPAWSPDGTRIAYVGRESEGVRNLFVVDVATGESTQITDGTRDVFGTQFTPDGSSVLYTGGSDEYPVLRTVPVDGGKSTLLVGPGEGVTDAGNGALSPDGSLVTFLGSGFPESSKPGFHCGPCRFVANADGTDRRVIPGWMVNPAGTWSPDGTRIASWNGRGIVVVDIATGNVSRVADGTGAIWLDRHTLLVEICKTPSTCDGPVLP
jgi:Tol biopolymer transport system component